MNNIIQAPLWSVLWLSLLTEGKYKAAFQAFLIEENKGDANAQSIIGAMYEDGYGVIRDDKQALKWYRLVAQQLHAT